MTAVKLHPREIEVMKWLCDGKTAGEVASILGISEQTVKNHKHSVMNKTDCHSTALLVRWAIREGHVQA